MILPAIGLAAALTAVHVPFAVTVNGGAEVTRQPLAVHQVITCGGVAHTVQLVRESHGTYTVVLSPRLTASAVCST
jgi:hypothetical protein